MSLSWRITTTFDDRSQRAIASSASGTGATVVAGSRSLEEPVLFAKGENAQSSWNSYKTGSGSP